jgi:hypothetical protein
VCVSRPSCEDGPAGLRYYVRAGRGFSYRCSLIFSQEGTLTATAIVPNMLVRIDKHLCRPHLGEPRQHAGAQRAATRPGDAVVTPLCGQAGSPRYVEQTNTQRPPTPVSWTWAAAPRNAGTQSAGPAQTAASRSRNAPRHTRPSRKPAPATTSATPQWLERRPAPARSRPRPQAAQSPR